ncbi:MAG TPA: GNAT family N-acetyltransferase [Acidimicrobiia bacterium]
MTVVRSARSSDAGAIVALWRTVDDVLPSVTDDERAVTTLLTRDPTSMLVAEEAGHLGAGHLVGTLIVGWDGWRGNLYRLAVDPSARRRGVARTLVEQAEIQLCGARVPASVSDRGRVGTARRRFGARRATAVRTRCTASSRTSMVRDDPPRPLDRERRLEAGRCAARDRGTSSPSEVTFFPIYRRASTWRSRLAGQPDP